jgi:hypothetical protein
MNPMNRRQPIIAMTLLLAFAGLGFHGALRAADGAAAPAGSRVLKFNPGVTQSAILARPDTDFVEFSDGRRMRVGDLRRLDAAAQRMRAAGSTRALPPGLKTRPAATGTPVQNRGDLAAALKRPGGDTLQLPSGRRLTAEQLRFLLPEIEKRLGQRIGDVQREPSRAGPALKVNARTNWREILKKPDSTILESSSGKRITVGEIKRALPKSRPRTAPGNTSRGRR